jgi:hypothetical protein
MALNGAYAALIEAGFPVPKYFAALDSREVNVNFLRTARKETEFLLAAQCHPKMFDLLDGFHVTTFHLNTETEQTVYGAGYEGLFLGSAGGTIGTTALAIAGVLGYRHLILVGFDSSHVQNLSHLVLQPQNASQQTLDVEFDGKWYTTTPTLAAQVNEFLPWTNALIASFPGLALDFIGQGLLYDYIEANAKAGVASPDDCKTTREEELARYPSIYAEDPEYKCTDRRLAGLKDALIECQAFGGMTYLDVSCGRGESLDLARGLGYTASGTETVPQLIAARDDVQAAVLPNTGLPDQCADVVSLIEVIEHLVPADVEPALRELGRLARKYIIVSAATFPSWKNGANLHPSARTEAKWDALLRSIWGDRVAKAPSPIHPSPAWIITL